MRNLILMTAVISVLGMGSCAEPSLAKSGCNTKSCEERLEQKSLAREMASYKARPMPRCTWYGESGRGEYGEWEPARYRVWNTGGTSIERASGKYQILGSTWRNFGGGQYARYAAYATPVQQERIARKILSDSIHHWVNC